MVATDRTDDLLSDTSDPPTKLEITNDAITKLGRAGAPKMEILLIIETVWTYNNLSFNVAIHVLDYSENGGEVGLLAVLDYQKRSNVLYSPLTPQLGSLEKKLNWDDNQPALSIALGAVWRWNMVHCKSYCWRE